MPRVTTRGHLYLELERLFGRRVPRLQADSYFIDVLLHPYVILNKSLGLKLSCRLWSLCRSVGGYEGDKAQMARNRESQEWTGLQERQKQNADTQASTCDTIHQRISSDHVP